MAASLITIIEFFRGYYVASDDPEKEFSPTWLVSKNGWTLISDFIKSPLGYIFCVSVIFLTTNLLFRFLINTEKQSKSWKAERIIMINILLLLAYSLFYQRKFYSDLPHDLTIFFDIVIGVIAILTFAFWNRN